MLLGLIGSALLGNPLSYKWGKTTSREWVVIRASHQVIWNDKGTIRAGQNI